MYFDYDTYLGKITAASNIFVVRDHETIQQVINRLPRSTNQNFLILVPPGHDDEYFVSRPNIDVVFLNNIISTKRYVLLDGWNNLDNWSLSDGFISADLEESEFGERIKLAAGPGYHMIEFVHPIDLREYQGIVLDFWFTNTNTDNPVTIRPKIYFGENSGWVGVSPNFSKVGTGEYHRTVFLPFGIDDFNFNYVNLYKIDWAKAQLQLVFDNLNSGDIVYLSDLKLVRTVPEYQLHVNVSLATIDDNYGIQFVRSLLDRGIPCSLSVVGNKIDGLTISNNSYPSIDLLHSLSDDGLEVVSWSTTQPYFSSLDDNATRFEVEASCLIFERAGLQTGRRWWRLPYDETNVVLERLLKQYGYNVLTPYIDGLPVGLITTSLENINYQFSKLRKGGLYLISLTGADLTNEEQMDQALSLIDDLYEKYRFVSLRNIEQVDCRISTSASTTNYNVDPAYYYTFVNNDEVLTISFFHKKLFLDPNGYNVQVHVDTTGLKPGDEFVIMNIGSSGTIVFDPSGVNVTLPANSSVYRFVWF